MSRGFDSIESVIEDLSRGQMVIVVDDADRENEGDLILAAEHVDSEKINFMVKKGGGLICVPTTAERLKQLGIGDMVNRNRDALRTAFQVSVDARKAAHRTEPGQFKCWQIRLLYLRIWFNPVIFFL